MLGIIFSHIVGIRHYNVPVMNNDKVEFCRDSENQYDSNAIAVTNISNQKLGFLPRYTASILAPLLDNGSIKIKGFVYSQPSERNVPLAIEIYLLDRGKYIIEKRNAKNKDDEIHNGILEIFLNINKYSKNQILNFRRFYHAIAVLPETKLLHNLLEYNQINAYIKSDNKTAVMGQTI